MDEDALYHCACGDWHHRRGLGCPLDGKSVQVITFTPREHDIMRLVCTGLTVKEVAGKLEISAHTTKFHLNNVRAKLRARNTTHAAVTYDRANRGDA